MNAGIIQRAESRFFVTNAEDRFGRTHNFWAVWYRNRTGALTQTGDEPFFFRWTAQRAADRYNQSRDGLQDRTSLK